MSGAETTRPLAMFPASFDPVTNGHLDIISRAVDVFGEIVVAVARNVGKQGTFSLEERLEMLNSAIGEWPGVRVTTIDGLTVDFAREVGAKVLIRGLRMMSDFEYEFEMALMNQHLYPEVETVFIMASQKYLYVSSSRLKELARFGRSVDEFVPSIAAKMLHEKLGRR